MLLTLYAAVVERFAGGEDAEEEGGDAAAGTAPQAVDAAALEAASAFAASLAALAEQGGDGSEGGGAVAQLAALAQQHAAVLGAMQETAALAASVRVAAELHQRLADFDAAVAGGSYSEAAWIAVELQKAVQAVPDSADTAAAVAACVEPLQQQLQGAVYGCCAVDPASRLPVLLPAGGGAGTAGTAAVLAEVWRALQVFGLLPQALQQLAAYVMEHSVAPILASGKAGGERGQRRGCPDAASTCPTLP